MKTSQVPVVRPISWPATIPQMLAIALAAGVGYAIDGRDGVMWGGGVYLLYSFGSRIVILRDHRRGMALVRQEKFADAIAAFEASLVFLGIYPWIDTYRSVVLMSPSAMSYREMALNNIAFCFAQLGDGNRARKFYDQVLEEFPENGMARTALRLMEAGKD